jgi:hypothetical protein
MNRLVTKSNTLYFQPLDMSTCRAIQTQWKIVQFDLIATNDVRILTPKGFKGLKYLPDTNKLHSHQ